MQMQSISPIPPILVPPSTAQLINRRHPSLSFDPDLEIQYPIYECDLLSPTTHTIFEMPRAARCVAGGRGEMIDITYLPLIQA
jgi:hypothetical protein